MRGQNDFGVYAQKSSVGALSDLADLAVRIGSIVWYDRRGDVVRAEDFEGSTEKWLGGSDAMNPNPYSILDDSYCQSGSQAIKIYINGGVGSFRSVSFFTAPYPLGKWGVEVSIGLTAGDYWIILESIVYDGINKKTATMRLNAEDKLLEYRDSLDAYQTLQSSFQLYDNVLCFNHFKLVADFKNDLYSRIMLNSNEYDLSAYAIKSELSVILPHHLFNIYFWNRSGIARLFWMDDFILTINEP